MAAAQDAATAAAAAGGEHHGLSSGWSFWEQRSKKGEKEPWQERTLEVCKFDTVEAFWAVYTLLPTPLEYFGFKEQKPVELQREDDKEPGALRTSTSKESLLFREGISPFTEFLDADGAQVNRSRLDIKVSLRRPEDAKDVCAVWEYIVLGVIGETLLPDCSIVTGVKISDKSRDGPKGPSYAWRIEVWMNVDGESTVARSAKKALEKDLGRKQRMIRNVDLKSM